MGYLTRRRAGEDLLLKAQLEFHECRRQMNILNRDIARMEAISNNVECPELDLLRSQRERLKGELLRLDAKANGWAPLVDRDYIPLAKPITPVAPRHRRSSTPRLKAPPGHLLLKLTEFIYSPKSYEHVFRQAVYDMREEYFALWEAGRRRKARWVQIRGTYGVLMAAARLTLGGIVCGAS